MNNDLNNANFVKSFLVFFCKAIYKLFSDYWLTCML